MKTPVEALMSYCRERELPYEEISKYAKLFLVKELPSRGEFMWYCQQLDDRAEKEFWRPSTVYRKNY
jgi:hypothetical protein